MEIYRQLINLLDLFLFFWRWIVEDDESLPNNPSFLCDNCFKGFKFYKGDKVGSFQYYPYPESKLEPIFEWYNADVV